MILFLSITCAHFLCEILYFLFSSESLYFEILFLLLCVLFTDLRVEGICQTGRAVSYRLYYNIFCHILVYLLQRHCRRHPRMRTPFSGSMFSHVIHTSRSSMAMIGSCRSRVFHVDRPERSHWLSLVTWYIIPYLIGRDLFPEALAHSSWSPQCFFSGRHGSHFAAIGCESSHS